MYYIYRSPSSNNIIHVTQYGELYSERMLLEEVRNKETVKIIAAAIGKEICWCDTNPIPHSLS